MLGTRGIRPDISVILSPGMSSRKLPMILFRQESIPQQLKPKAEKTTLMPESTKPEIQLNAHEIPSRMSPTVYHAQGVQTHASKIAFSSLTMLAMIFMASSNHEGIEMP